MPRFDFVLVPGAGGRAWYWHRVAAKLEKSGHEAVPISLPVADDTAELLGYAPAELGEHARQRNVGGTGGMAAARMVYR